MHALRSTATAPRWRPSARSGRIAGYAIEVGLLVAALALTRLLTIYVWRLPNGDVTLYHRYALAFWTQPPPLHALPVEYPPWAILPFTLAILPPLADYLALYAYWMGAFVVVGYLGFLRYSTRQRAIAYALYLLVGSTATLLARFDIIPALLTLAALWAAERRRFAPAYVLIAAGVLLKLYPIFLLPVILIAHWHALTPATGPVLGSKAHEGPRGWLDGAEGFVRRLQALWDRPSIREVARGAALCLGVVALGFGVALALNPTGALSGFGYAGDRPLQVESTPATLLWLGTLVGIPARPEFSYASLNYVGPLDALLKPLSAIALASACGVVYLRQARGRLALGQAFLACLCAVIATNKLFSPQYLIWVLPAVAAVEGFDLLWLAVCALTTLVYPVLYLATGSIATAPENPAFMPLVAARNLLLIVLTLRTIVRPRSSSLDVRLGLTGAITGSIALREAARRVTLMGDRRADRRTRPSAQAGKEHLLTSPATRGRDRGGMGRQFRGGGRR